MNQYSPTSQRSYRFQGFTLIELSVVITILGLLLAGVIKGKSLLEASKLQSTIKEISQLREAILLFKEKYRYLPGDIPNGSTYFSTALSGDGNGTVAGNEELYTWQHLTSSGFIPGNYSGAVINAGTRFIPGTNAPAAATGGGYGVRSEGIFSHSAANALSLASTAADGDLTNSALKTKDAQVIDRKIDDGTPDGGILYVTRGIEYYWTANTCVSNDAATSSATSYVSTSEYNTCRLMIWLEDGN